MAGRSSFDQTLRLPDAVVVAVRRDLVDAELALPPMSPAPWNLPEVAERNWMQRAAITGTPLAAASSTAFGKPSRHEGSTITSMTR